MKRLTHDGLFCDIAKCNETPGGTFCENGSCSQRKVWERLKEYEDMEEHGRLVVLPCKVGDWVYALWDVPTAAKYVIYCAEVKEIRISNRNCRPTTTYLLEPIEYRGRRKEYRDDDFGKTVFLTREEAERAIAGGADHA